MRGLSLSWIDATELSVSLNRAGVAPLDPAFAPAVTGAATPSEPKTGEMSRAEVSSLSSTVKSGSVSSDRYDPPDAPLAERLSGYLHWVTERTGCSQIFVVDSDGLVLMDRNADPDIVAMAALFVNVLNQVDTSLGAPTLGSMAIDLDVDESLHVVQAETGLGPHAVGFSVERPVDRETIDVAREGLVRVLSSIKDIETGE